MPLVIFNYASSFPGIDINKCSKISSTVADSKSSKPSAIRSRDSHVTFVLKYEMEGLPCPFCLFFAPSQQLLYKPVILVHSLDSNFKI